MQRLTCWKGRRTLLLLLLTVFPLTNGACEFPKAWEGQWFQSGKPPVTINATMLGEKMCIEKSADKYAVYDGLSSENCYKCLIINDRHTNAIQFREVGDCSVHERSLQELCDRVYRTDDSLYTMFRLNSEPIPCPFPGAPFTFTYKSGEKECKSPISHAESCSDSSKLLLKYQACPDVEFSESTTEELQCLASWKEGRNKYLVGTIKLFGRSAATNEETFRCFLYETPLGHHPGEKVAYELAQSGDSTCSALNAVSEGSRTIKLTKVDKDRSRCKYPSWVTEHHDWHSLDGSQTYHFTSRNATLKVTGIPHEERIVCHNIVEPIDNTLSKKVKLVAHITSGCDIGYVCMIFHRRDGNVIELQQSDRKAVVPEEACQVNDLLKMPYTTLITSTLKKKKCPQPGRYRVISYDSSQELPTTPRRQRRGINISQRSAEKMTWSEDSEDAVCNVSDLQIGCGSADQSEMIISNTCEHKQLVYSCHDSWEEKGVWYTIVSQTGVSSSTSSSSSISSSSGSSSSSSSGSSGSSGSNSGEQTQTTLGRQTFCFSMHWVDPVPKVPGGRGARLEQQEQELWLSGPAREFQRGATDPWTYYRLASQGVCEDLTRASAASSSSLSRVSLILAAGAALLCKLLSR